MLATLVKASPLNKTTGARTDVYLSNVGDKRGALVNGLDGRVWEPAILRAPTIGMQLWSGDFTAEVAPGQAALVINTATTKRTYTALDDCVWMGAPIEIYAADPGTAWPWPKVFAGKIKTYGGDSPNLQLSAEVDQEPFTGGLLGSSYAGTGGVEGGADIKNRLKPLCIGWPQNVEPLLINAVDNVYQFSAYGAIEAVTKLYERGADFGAAQSDYANYAALVGATIPPGRWATCLDLGLVRLGAPAYGVITGDIKGHKVGSATPRLPGAMISALAAIAGVSTDLIETATLTAMDSGAPYPVSLFLDSQETILDLAQRIALDVNWIAGVSLAGKLFASSISLAGSSAITFDRQGRAIPQVKTAAERQASPPYAKTTLGANRAWRVHSADEIAFATPLVEKGRYAASDTYREGNIVDLADGSRWVYVNAAPGTGNAPPDWPATSNAHWENLSPPSVSLLTGYLTNESHTVAAEADGTVPSFAGAGGTFRVLLGATDVTAPSTFAVLSETGVDVSINASGVYSVASMSADQGTAVLTATHNGVTIDRTYSIAKASGGAAAKLFFLISDAQQIKYNTAGALISGQTVTLTGQRQNTTANLIVRLYRINANGTQTQIDAGAFVTGSGTVTDNTPDANSFTMTGLTASLSGANFNTAVSTGIGVIVEVTCDGITDKISIIKVQDGAVGTPGADSVTGYLTNEAHTVSADSIGNVASYSGATGNFVVMKGSADISASFTLTTISNPQALTIGYSGRTYTVSGGFDAGEQTATVTIRATGGGSYAGVVIDKVFTLGKAKTGITGNTGDTGSPGAPGAAALSMVINKKSVGLFAYANGTVVDYAQAQGLLKVYLGSTDITSLAAISASVSSGVTGTVNNAANSPVSGQPKGYYRVTAMGLTTDSGSMTLSATYGGQTITDTFSLVKTVVGYEIVGALPATNLFEGRVVFYNGRLYTYKSAPINAWRATIDVDSALDGAKLDPKTVYASKMAITADNLVQDAEYYDLTSYWQPNTSIASITAGVDASSAEFGQARYMAINGIVPGAAGWTNLFNTIPITTVQGNKEYYVAVNWYNNRNCTVLIRLTWYADLAGTEYITDSYMASFNYPIALHATPISAVAPPTTRSVRVQMWVDRSILTGGLVSDFAIGRILVKEKNAGQLLVDGDVLARHLGSQSVTTDKLDAGAVTAAKANITHLSALTSIIGLLRTAPTGGRMELSDNVLRVYDSSNVLRVKLGNLDL